MRNLFEKFLSLFAVPVRNRALVQAQMRELARRTPLLYIITCISAICLAIIHYSVAPYLQTVILPSVLVFLCGVRIWFWVGERGQKYNHRESVQKIRASIALAAFMGIAFSTWALSLYPFGDRVLHGYIAFFLVVTSICVTSSLLYLRAVALAVVLSVLVPFCIFYVSTGEIENIAVTLQVTLVVATVIYLVLNNHKDFVRLISSNLEAQKLSNENLDLANRDSLTGLPNRRKFFEQLEHRHHSDEDGEITIGLLDIDGFKPINDVYGHIAGDRLLIEIAQRLAEFQNGKFSVARLGGDEFGFIASPALTDVRATQLGNQICAAVSAPIAFEFGDVHVAASIGVVSGRPNAQTDAIALYEKADHALYFAKQNQRGTAVVFSQEHENAIRQRSFIETQLRSADLESELDLVFQPIFDLKAKRIASFEALARWTNNGVAISPDVFIQQAERSGIMGELTRLLLAKALKYAKDWPSEVGMSFNLSAADLGSPASMAQVTKLVKQSGFPAHRLTFEVTETSIIRDFESSKASLFALKKLGARIALDDFGTGYSSLSYLQKLPFDHVKLDKSFVDAMENDGKTRSIVRSLIQLVHGLGISVVVEGVETEGQSMLLGETNCEFLQGFFLSRPVAQPELLEMCAQNSNVTQLLPTVQPVHRQKKLSLGG